MLQYLAARSYVFGYPYVTPDDGVVPDGDASKNGAITVYDDIIFEDGVPVNAFDGVALIVEGKVLGTKRDSLIKCYVVP